MISVNIDAREITQLSRQLRMLEQNMENTAMRRSLSTAMRDTLPEIRKGIIERGNFTHGTPHARLASRTGAGGGEISATASFSSLARWATEIARTKKGSLSVRGVRAAAARRGGVKTDDHFGQRYFPHGFLVRSGRGFFLAQRAHGAARLPLISYSAESEAQVLQHYATVDGVAVPGVSRRFMTELDRQIAMALR